jgi:hypothetical protein
VLSEALRGRGTDNREVVCSILRFFFGDGVREWIRPSNPLKNRRLPVCEILRLKQFVLIGVGGGN